METAKGGPGGKHPPTPDKVAASAVVRSSAEESRARGLTLDQAVDAAESALKSKHLDGVLDRGQIRVLIAMAWRG